MSHRGSDDEHLIPPPFGQRIHIPLRDGGLDFLIILTTLDNRPPRPETADTTFLKEIHARDIKSTGAAKTKREMEREVYPSSLRLHCLADAPSTRPPPTIHHAPCIVTKSRPCVLDHTPVVRSPSSLSIDICVTLEFDMYSYITPHTHGLVLEKPTSHLHGHDMG
jgi:hypothetical protein